MEIVARSEMGSPTTAVAEVAVVLPGVLPHQRGLR